MGRKSMADTRRQEIIDAFYRCVNSEGLASASIRKIAGQAGVQPSVIHHYFKDRDEMIAQMVTFFSDTIFTDFIRKMDRYKNPETRFFKALEFMYSPGMINEEYSGFFLECCVEARRNPRVRETLARTFSRFRQTIIANIEAMDILNDLTKQQKENYASMMIAVHEGLELQWYIDPRAVSLKKAAALSRQIIDMIVADSRRVSAPETGGDGIE
ncbi:MAG: TetR/AcrR family transcriptional regulator [Thermodesulfobacteriota bacterium]